MDISFKRITSTGRFIPEIDGLRFIAVSSVVLYHFWCFFNVKDTAVYTDSTDYSFFAKLLSHGNFGVPLFFAISGFILGMPFAKFYLDGGNRVNLKKYFLRRLTRLEPPYIITMTVLLFGAVYVAKTIALGDALVSYFSSVFYVHNFVFPGHFPKLNAVAWSLEIEVQFYILAPLLAYLFTIKSANVRRFSMAGISVLFIAIGYFNPLPFISLINFLHYFLIGFLLADLYVSQAAILPKTNYDYLLGLFFLSVIWLFEKGDFRQAYQNFLWETLQCISIFLLYYYVLFHKIFRFLSLRLITNIGGMCYTIYLIHYPIISMFGNPLIKFTFSQYSFINIAIHTVLLMIPIAILCALFFLLVERPCMDKDWYKKILKSRKVKAA